LLWQATRRDPLNPVRFWRAEWRRVWRRQRYPTGLLVAILGPDGAGKTTLIQHLMGNLTGAFRRVDAFHLRPNVLGSEGTHSPVTDPHGKPLLPWWLSLLKLPYYLLDYALGYLFKVRPRLVRSTLVLFDRYYDDLLVDPRRYRYGGPSGLARLARNVIPQPDLFLIVDVPEEALLTRKQEVSPEEVCRQREAYRTLAMQLPNAVLLDGSLAPAEVARHGSEVIVEYLQARYLKRLHRWFHDNGSETLKWLEAVLFPPAESHLAPAPRSNGGPLAQSRADGALGWLTCTDGRGYLIPLNSRHVGFGALQLYNAQTLKARALKKSLMIGLKSGFAPLFLRKVRLRTSRDLSRGGAAAGFLLAHLRQLLGREDLQFGISLGTPGPHRKPVLQALAPDGTVIAYAKVGWNEATNALVRNEADVLRRLRDAPCRCFTVPTVLCAGPWEWCALCIQSPPTDGAQTAPKTLTPLYLAAQREMAARHLQWLPLSKSALWASLRQRIERTRSTYYRQLLQQGVHVVEAWLGGRLLPFHFSHGDFTPWNARLLNGQLFLFDWEYASWEAPPGHDLFHFTVQTARLLSKRSPWLTYKSIQRGETAGRWIAGHLKSLGAGEVEVEPLLLLYALERLAFYAAEHDADAGALRYFANLANLVISEAPAGRWGDP
jgi:thymidylate kinase